MEPLWDLTDYARKIEYYACGHHPENQSFMLKVMLGWRFYASNYVGLKWCFALLHLLNEHSCTLFHLPFESGSLA